MQPVTKIDRAMAGLLTAETLRALKSVGEYFGLEVTVAGSRFNSLAGTYTPKVEFKVKVTASGKSQEQVDFERMCREYGAEPQDYKATFIANAQRYELVAFLPQREKYKVAARRISDGKTMLFPVDVLRKPLDRVELVSTEARGRKIVVGEGGQ